MPEPAAGMQLPLALNTKLEEDFISPLTAVRGAIEILRDYPDLAADERNRFIETALRECARLEKGVADLAETVYAAGQRAHLRPATSLSPETYREYAGRIRFHDAIDVVEIDFSDFAFRNSKIVNDFHDVIEAEVSATGRDWYFVVNHQACSVWPEAWVAFAHRGKKVQVAHALATVRYAAEPDSGDQSSNASRAGHDPNMFASRDLALAHVEELRHAADLTPPQRQHRH